MIYGSEADVNHKCEFHPERSEGWLCMKWFVYILECNDGSLYTGSTNDLKRRLKEHQKGGGGKYTRTFGLKQIRYVEELDDRLLALRREKEIKGFSRIKKFKLMEACLALRPADGGTQDTGKIF